MHLRLLVDAPKLLVDAPKLLVDAPKLLVDAPKLLVDAPKLLVDAIKVSIWYTLFCEFNVESKEKVEGKWGFPSIIG